MVFSFGDTHFALSNRFAEKEGQMSSGQMPFGAILFLGKHPSGHMSSGQMSFWANVLLGKHPSGQTSSGQIYFWANVFLGK
jgi:hypothetical protein